MLDRSALVASCRERHEHERCLAGCPLLLLPLGSGRVSSQTRGRETELNVFSDAKEKTTTTYRASAAVSLYAKKMVLLLLRSFFLSSRFFFFYLSRYILLYLCVCMYAYENRTWMTEKRNRKRLALIGKEPFYLPHRPMNIFRDVVNGETWTH